VHRPPVRLGTALASCLCVLVVTVLAACGDTTRPPSPLAPTDAPRLATTGAAACLRTNATYLSQNISALVSDQALRREARTLEGAVESACRSATAQPYPASTLAATQLTAPYAAIRYAEWLFAKRGTSGFVASDAVLWSYVARVFGYVGYTVPTSTAALTDSGFVKVCTSGSACLVASPDSQKAVNIAPNALSLTAGIPFLVTGTPVACSPFSSATGYAVYGGCLQISVDPKSTPSFQLKAPGTVVELCTRNSATVTTPLFIHQRRTDVYTGATTTQGKLAQRSERAGDTYSPVSFRRYTAGLIDDKYCDHPYEPTATTGLAALRRVGASLLALFQPTVAYAGHGGLGTLPGLADEEFSVFGPLDGFALNGDFEQDAIGAFPVSGRPEMRGTSWDIGTTPNPSRAQVRSGGPLGTRYLWLDQGGGASSSKDSLTFNGTLATPLAPQPGDGDRTIRLRVRAAIATSRALNARFEALSSTGTRFGTFEFRDGAGAQSGTVHPLIPGGATVVGTAGSTSWSTNGVLELQITVAFNVTASLATVAVGLVEQPALATYTLPISALPNLAKFRWILAGRDGVRVISDDYQAFDAPVGAP
jgi:hypothetical protein